jgi:STE24 endopeptidase
VKRHLRLPLALAAAVAVAEAAVLLLRPRAGVIPPDEVPLQGYFSAEEVRRGRAFSGPQLALAAARGAVELGVLAACARRPPRAGAFATGAAISAATTVAALPVAALARRRGMDVGLITQSWGGWAGDLAKSTAIGTVVSGAGGAAAVALQGRFGARWWLPASAGVVGLAGAVTYTGPVVLDPIFNRFDRLPEGDTRADVLALAAQAGVEVGEVFVVDGSRRTTAANAYVTGLGRTKRVVLYDTLLEHFTRDEVRLVVAHELAHVRFRDVPGGLLFLALVAPATLLAAARVAERLGPAQGPEAVPAVALALSLVAPPIGAVSLQLSRAIERRADAYSLQLTDAPEPFIGFERRIAVRNVVDPDPPAWRTALLASHPPTIERIGTAVAYQRGVRWNRGAVSSSRSSRPHA